jgi:hypothetical protein
MITRRCPNSRCPDIELFGVQGEYREPVEVCPKCGTALVAALEPGEPADAGSDVEPRDVTTLPDLPDQPGDLVPLCTVSTAAELAIVESLLIAARVFYFVHNRHFGGFISGPFIPLYNVRTVFVPSAQIEAARQAIAAPVPEPWGGTEFRAEDRIRALLELLMFGWVVPLHRRRPGEITDA